MNSRRVIADALEWLGSYPVITSKDKGRIVLDIGTKYLKFLEESNGISPSLARKLAKARIERLEGSLDLYFKENQRLTAENKKLQEENQRLKSQEAWFHYENTR